MCDVCRRRDERKSDEDSATSQDGQHGGKSIMLDDDDDDDEVVQDHVHLKQQLRIKHHLHYLLLFLTGSHIQSWEGWPEKYGLTVTLTLGVYEVKSLAGRLGDTGVVTSCDELKFVTALAELTPGASASTAREAL